MSNSYFSGIKIFLLICLAFLMAGCISKNKRYILKNNGEQFVKRLSLDQIEVIGTQTIQSNYFDKALGFKNSRLTVVSFKRFLKLFDKRYAIDGVLLNCFDDYQGVVSINDIYRYNLQLATRINLGSSFDKPDWLNPLMIVVPDGSEAPGMERFLTANIREIRGIQMKSYYAPLYREIGGSVRAKKGRDIFQNNCLFCHSVKGIGGNKGIPLLSTYRFSDQVGKKIFQNDFQSFHGKPGPDNISQFVNPERLLKVAFFLELMQTE